MTQKNPKVDAFIRAELKWHKELIALRKTALSFDLVEDFKWGLPCYTLNGKNILILQNFKHFCAILFFNGAQLTDPKGLLKPPGANSQAGRRLEFENVPEIEKSQAALTKFIKEAVQTGSLTSKAPKKPSVAPAVPAEFKIALDKNKKLKLAFEQLTPGRQRLYLIHFSSAKQSATRTSRIEKCIPKILKGLGLNES